VGDSVVNAVRPIILENFEVLGVVERRINGLEVEWIPTETMLEDEVLDGSKSCLEIMNKFAILSELAGKTGELLNVAGFCLRLAVLSLNCIEIRTNDLLYFIPSLHLEIFVPCSDIF